MVKLSAIALSGALHGALLLGVMAGGAGDLSGGGGTVVRLVVAVPVAAAGHVDEAIAQNAAAPGRPGAPQREAPARVADNQAPSKVLAGVAVTPAAPSPTAGETPIKAPAEVAGPSVPAPIMTPERGPAPAPEPASMRTAPAAPVAARAVDTAPTTGLAPTGGTSPGEPVQTTPAVLLAAAQPEYPADAHRAGHEGRVVVKAFVDAAGAVGRTSIEVSSGFAALDTAAVAAVSSYQFRPEIRNGTAVASTILVPIRFSLTDTGQ